MDLEKNPLKVRWTTNFAIHCTEVDLHSIKRPKKKNECFKLVPAPIRHKMDSQKQYFA